ncbi:hypothetical protein Tco_1207482 [Tanacetum coccineum]
MIPGTKPEPLKIARTEQRARSYDDRDPGHLLAFEMRCSATREYPSLIDTFFVKHTVNEEETLRLKSLGSNTESGVPYTDEEINALARKGKQSDDKFSKMLTQYESTPESGNGSGKCGDDEMADDEDNGEDEEDEEDGDS